jgi:hypothetical protein
MAGNTTVESRTAKFAPGWLRSQILAAIRRNGHKRLLNDMARNDPKALLDIAVKLEPKDINTQTQVNIRVVSIPAKVTPGTAIEPAEYRVLPTVSDDVPTGATGDGAQVATVAQ